MNQTILRQDLNIRCNRSFLVLSIFLIAIVSCTVQLVPNYDEKVYDTTVAIGKQIDTFFISVLDTKSDERTYSRFADDWSSIEAEIGSLLLQQKARSKNEDMIEATSRALKLWTDNKTEFQNSDQFYRSDGRVRLHKNRFADVFTAIAKGEKFLQSTEVIE